MLAYETLMLSNADISEENVSLLRQNIEAMVLAGKGKVVSFDNWGKYRLSYPVRKNEYGTYMLARYELPEDTAEKILAEIQQFFRIKANDVVFRYVSKKLEDGFVSYTKPESVEAKKESKFENTRRS